MAKKKSKSSTKSAAPAKAGRTSVPAAAAASPAPAKAAAPAAPVATPADVSARAHQIWIARGKPTPGTPLADWLEAERELGIRKT